METCLSTRSLAMGPHVTIKRLRSILRVFLYSNLHTSGYVRMYASLHGIFII
jgi:hypothetical protein